MPGFIKPQLATLKSKAPKGEEWIHEIKYDGYPVQVHTNAGRKKVFTRNGLDWTKRFSSVAAALEIRGQAIVDGESPSTMACPRISRAAATEENRLVQSSPLRVKTFFLPALVWTWTG